MPRDSRILALRQQLAAEIVRSLGVDSQFVVGPSYGIRQPRMSERNRGIVDRCTVEWLIRLIHVLGGTVTLSVSSAMRGRRGCGSNSRGDAGRSLDSVCSRGGGAMAPECDWGWIAGASFQFWNEPA